MKYLTAAASITALVIRAGWFVWFLNDNNRNSVPDCNCILSKPLYLFAYAFYSQNKESRFSAFSSVQSLSHVRLCDPMNRSTPDLPVHHQPLELTQTHVHRAGYAIQPPHPLSSPSPSAPNPSRHYLLCSFKNKLVSGKHYAGLFMSP